MKKRISLLLVSVLAMSMVLVGCGTEDVKEAE